MSKKYVYFIKPIGMDGPVKIGCSEVPASRLLTFVPWSPFPLEIIGEVEAGFADENLLHKRFANLHTHREWFNSSPLLRQTIDRIIAGESIKSACAEIPNVGPIRKRTPPTPERQRWIDYGKRMRAINFRDEGGRWRAPSDVQRIMDAWQGDLPRFPSIAPTEQQIARLEEYLSDAKKHGTYVPWRSELVENGKHAPWVRHLEWLEEKAQEKDREAA